MISEEVQKLTGAPHEKLRSAAVSNIPMRRVETVPAPPNSGNPHDPDQPAADQNVSNDVSNGDGFSRMAMNQSEQ
jgi:hypothetical protein